MTNEELGMMNFPFGAFYSYADQKGGRPMSHEVTLEAQRCLNCRDPQCQRGCPIHTPIPQIIQQYLQGKHDEAGRALFENNPLTTVCALVCSHENQCEGHCILGKKGKPVRFSQIEHHISSDYASKMTAGPAPSNGMRAAIIGAGPAGLTIAVLLARKGYQVTIFEGKDKIGGVLRYGIPDFRLPKDILEDFEYRHLHLKGIRVRPNTAVGVAVTIDDLFRDGYKAIFIGTGVWLPNTLGVKGETLGHVHYAIHYLHNPDAYRLGKSLIIIGAGTAAMDVARTALRRGVEKVTVYSRTDRIAADKREQEHARSEGVEFVVNKQTVEIAEEGVLFRDTDKPDSEPVLHPADSVIIAISQGPRNRIVSTTTGLETNDRGLLVTDDCGRTTRLGVFASGDVVNGARTVVEAVARSKKVAEAMDEYMKNA